MDSWYNSAEELMLYGHNDTYIRQQYWGSLFAQFTGESGSLPIVQYLNSLSDGVEVPFVIKIKTLQTIRKVVEFTGSAASDQIVINLYKEQTGYDPVLVGQNWQHYLKDYSGKMVVCAPQGTSGWLGGDEYQRKFVTFDYDMQTVTLTK